MTQPSQPPDIPTPSHASVPPPFDELVLLVLTGSARGRKVRVEERVRVGSATDNELVLPDPTVSRYHCVFERRREGVVVRDLGSTHHTKVGQTSIQEVTLAAGSTIQVGSVELMLRSEPNRAQALPSERSEFGDAVGTSLTMRTIFGLLERVAPTDTGVLLEGETGTGKALLARAIHQRSARKDHPFVSVDCGAISYNLLESELFGHERGAYTGAVELRRGAFELAGEGTLFLDEVAELPLDLQPKLLSVLESGELRRLGGTTALRASARIIAASKRNLREEVERGKFLQALYFRLSPVPITLPPLRQRREDIPLLVERFLQQARALSPNAANVGVSPDTIAGLSAHDWPGNLHELHAILDQALRGLAGAPDREPRALSVPLLVAASSSAETPSFEAGKSYREVRSVFESDFERRYVSWLLQRHAGNISAAAREAKMDRKHLYDLARKHGLRGERG
ncbi:MAG TPA: sigma 54-interacting transcriptional regulator [Polyangiaceae bacterium]|nr:sigma 54-interacting transcriptional regulator [Polyangiaceae bacterium]